MPGRQAHGLGEAAFADHLVDSGFLAPCHSFDFGQTHQAITWNDWAGLVNNLHEDGFLPYEPPYIRHGSSGYGRNCRRCNPSESRCICVVCVRRGPYRGQKVRDERPACNGLATYRERRLRGQGVAFALASRACASSPAASIKQNATKPSALPRISWALASSSRDRSAQDCRMARFFFPRRMLVTFRGGRPGGSLGVATGATAAPGKGMTTALIAHPLALASSPRGWTHASRQPTPTGTP